MERVYGYVRVSTLKQGDGVSLIEQKSAIQEFAQKNNLSVIRWFEEKVTASKEGRPAFNEMIKLLSKGKSDGACFHKIDRSSRNYGDWNKINILADAGINFYSVSDGINLSDEAQRLPADILAAMSTHYSRNLRKEVLKGFYGRLKQGFYPLNAPVGYQDMGGGKNKEIDPFYGPLIKKTFELYCTNRYGIIDLAKEMNKRGLRGKTGAKVTKTGISNILRNPFYMGIIRIKKTNEVFAGSHKPIISKALFNQAQRILDRKCGKKIRKHYLPFSKMMRCEHCQYALIGEIQRSHVYYRCHTKNCPTSPIKQEQVEVSLQQFLTDISLSKAQLESLSLKLHKTVQLDGGMIERELKGLRFKIVALDEKVDKLTDAVVDGIIEKDIFFRKKQRLIEQQIGIREKIEAIQEEKEGKKNLVDKFLEQLEILILKGKQQKTDEIVDLVKFSTSNILYNGEKLILQSLSPFTEVFLSRKWLSCPHSTDANRTNQISDNENGIILTYNVETQKNKKLSQKIDSELLAKKLIKVIYG